MALLLYIAGQEEVAPCDVRVSHIEFDSQATPCDVSVSWLELDTQSVPCDVKVSWLEFDCESQVQVTPVGGNKKRKRWLERDGRILVFESEEQAQAYIRAEKQPVPVNKKQNKLIAPKPVEIINKEEIKILSKVYNYRQQLYHADQIGDISRIIAIYKELQAREEEDLELLLMAL